MPNNLTLNRRGLMDRRRERNVVEDEANPPVVEQQETESDLWSDLLESFSSPAIVVETPKPPGFTSRGIGRRNSS